MALSLKNISAGYKNGPCIIRDINLTIAEGEIVTIIGPNGAGKSTVLKSIFGLTNIHKGTIQHESRVISILKTDQILRSGIAFVTQRDNVFADLTVEENLLMGAFTLQNKQEIQLKKEQILTETFPELNKYRSKKVAILSGGERQMVAIGMALMLSPEALCLDEPSIGLAPKIIAEVFEKIQQIAKTGTAILMVEQNAIAALKISDRAYVLENGKNALSGKSAELLDNPKVQKLYLGG